MFIMFYRRKEQRKQYLDGYCQLPLYFPFPLAPINFFKRPALHLLLCVCGNGERSHKIFETTLGVVWDKTVSRNQPVEPPKTGITRATSASQMALAARREPVYFLYPTPIAHNGFMALKKRSATGLLTPKGRKQATLNHALGRAVIVPVTNPMINGQGQAARGDGTSVLGWLRGSGAVSHSRAQSPSPQRLEGLGGRGRRTNYSPETPLSPNTRTVRGRQLAPWLALVSLLCVSFLPLVCQSWGEGVPTAQPPVPGQDPPLAAAQRASPGPAAGPERGRLGALPRIPRPRRSGPGVWGARIPPAPLVLPQRPAHLPAAPAGSG